MVGVDDVLDVAIAALTHEPEEPHLQPLFAVRVAGDRVTTRQLAPGGELVGVRQAIEVEGVGRFMMWVEEVGE